MELLLVPMQSRRSYFQERQVPINMSWWFKGKSFPLETVFFPSGWNSRFCGHASNKRKRCHQAEFLWPCGPCILDQPLLSKLFKKGDLWKGTRNLGMFQPHTLMDHWTQQKDHLFLVILASHRILILLCNNQPKCGFQWMLFDRQQYNFTSSLHSCTFGGSNLLKIMNMEAIEESEWLLLCQRVSCKLWIYLWAYLQ